VNTRKTATSVRIKQSRLTPPSKWTKRQWILAVAIVFAFAAAAGTASYITLHPAKTPTSGNLIIDQYRQNLPALKKTAESDSKNVDAQKNYAIALYASGDLQTAKTQYEAIVKTSPDAASYNNLANVYRDLGQTDDAVAAYTKAIELDGTLINSYANLANVQLYTLNKPTDAIATYQKGLAVLTNNGQLEFLLGVAYEQDGQTQLAQQTYEHILTYEPSNAGAKANLARLNEAQQ
jgi:tetratricopeptide (TPR) repeat protein